MKINLELNFSQNGIFLNYWDSLHGNDVCAKLLDNDIFDIDGEKVSFTQFISQVKSIVDTI